jgi:hypothetical protein
MDKNAVNDLIGAITDILRGAATGIPDTVINAVSVLTHEIQTIAIVRLLIFGVVFVVAATVLKRSVKITQSKKKLKEAEATALLVITMITILAILVSSIGFMWSLSPALAPHLELINLLKKGVQQ